MTKPGQDVAEACADALLAACAQALMLRSEAPIDKLPLDQVLDLAIEMLAVVTIRTQMNGAKPR